VYQCNLLQFCKTLASLLSTFNFYVGTREGRGHISSFIRQVERRFHDHELNRQPLCLVLGISPLSSGSLGSCQTTYFSNLKYVTLCSY
jgi:hypothetical protein